MTRPRVRTLAGLAVGVTWALVCIWYVSDKRPPLFYSYDLGADILAVGRLGAAATSLPNLLSMLGWFAWHDYTAFLYSPMGQYAIALPLEWIFRDPFRTVKFVQVAQLTIAALAAAWLYTELFGASRWRWFAGLLYASLPLCTLLVRGNMGFGWVAAVAPGAIAASIALVRRRGKIALPIAGLICGAASWGFSIEHGIFVGIPMFVLTIAFCRILGFRITPMAVIGAILAFCLFPAYTVLATVAEPRVMTFITANQGISYVLDLTSQSFPNQIANVFAENLISPDPAANASSNFPIALLGGTLTWLLAFVGFGFAIAKMRLRLWWPVLLVGLVSFVLALGTTVPFAGATLWNFFGDVPVLQALRTPNRFELINGVLIALAAALGAQRLAARGRLAHYCVLALAATIVLVYMAFDARERVLSVTSVDSRLPDFDAVNRSVESVGGRTAVFAFPRNGSIFDYPPYAPTNPSVSFAWDVAARFANVDAGTALLRRSAVRSVVTTPVWTTVVPESMPADMANLVRRSRYARPVARFDSGVSVFTIDGARPMLDPASPLCTIAGPAAFELAAGQPAFDRVALVHDNGADCSPQLLADHDPRDSVLPRTAIIGWGGSVVFGKTPALPPPNVFEVDRFGIATPWYRNEYAGDTLLTAQPFLTYGYASSTLSFDVPRDDRYAIYVRVSGLATVQTADPLGRLVAGECRRVEGFEWVKLSLGRLHTGSYKLPIELTSAPEADAPVVVDAVFIAPFSETPAIANPSFTLVSLRAFEPPLAIRSYQQLFPRPYSGIVSAKGQSALLGSGTHIGLFDGEMRITVTGRIGHVRFHWKGPTGKYVVAATGWLNEGAPTMTLDTGGQALKIRYDPSIGIAQTTGYAHVKLVRGASVDVLLDGRPGGVAALTKIIAMPTQPEETPTSYDDSGEIWEFGKADPLQFYEAIHSSDVAIASGAIRAFTGVTAELPFDPVFVHGRVTADVRVSGGKGATKLRCGAQSDQSEVGSGSENPGGAALVVERTEDVPCTLSVQWNSENMALEGVIVHARGAILRNWSAQQYFARGAYRWTARGAELLVDGRAWPIGTPLALSAGQHLLTLRRISATSPPLIFRRVGVPPSAPLPDLSVEERSATSWTVRAPAAMTLELAQFDDGNWFARTQTHKTYGYPCDLVNTCFDVDAGNVFVSRRIPPILALGLTITILDVAVAIALLFLPELRALSQRMIAGKISARAWPKAEP